MTAKSQGSKKSEPNPTLSSNSQQAVATNDPWYSKVVAKSGNIVSGGAALLVRTSAKGGMQNIITEVATAACQQASQAAVAAYVETQGAVIGFPKSPRRKRGT